MLHFFTNLKCAKLEEQELVPEDSDESHESDFSTAIHSDSEKDLDELIDGLKLCETKSKTC